MTLNEIAAHIGAELIDCDPDRVVERISPLEQAGENDISFLTNPRYKKAAEQSKAAAIIISEEDAKALSGLPLMIVASPYLAMAKVATLFMSEDKPEPGISKASFVAPDAVVDPSAVVSPMVYVGHQAKIGAGTILYPGVVIEDHVRVGEDCLIYPNSSILRGCQIGNRVIIHSGTVIGSDGYGFAPDGRRYQKIPQVGIVVIDDDCEIGANNTIDRATFGKTWIKRGVKTDNLVQIAHNVEVGEDTLLVAQVGISGSTKIGNHCILAGKVGVVGHIEIGDDVTIGAQSGINRSLPSGSFVSGRPAIPHKEALKVYATIPKLPEMRRQIIELTRQVKQLQKRLEEVQDGNQ